MNEDVPPVHRKQEKYIETYTVCMHKSIRLKIGNRQQRKRLM